MEFVSLAVDSQLERPKKYTSPLCFCRSNQSIYWRILLLNYYRNIVMDWLERMEWVNLAFSSEWLKGWSKVLTHFLITILMAINKIYIYNFLIPLLLLLILLTSITLGFPQHLRTWYVRQEVVGNSRNPLEYVLASDVERDKLLKREKERYRRRSDDFRVYPRISRNICKIGSNSIWPSWRKG